MAKNAFKLKWFTFWEIVKRNSLLELFKKYNFKLRDGSL